jgi:hypothetical protein
MDPHARDERRQHGLVDDRRDCGQPRLIGSCSAPSSIICTNSSMTKLRSSVVTTSSAPNFSLRSAGPSISSAPASAPAISTSGIITAGGATMAPEPTATAASAPA